jgi:uncharacterized metal-binding protein
MAAGLIGGGVAVALAAMYGEPGVTMAVAEGCLIGLLITPDADFETATEPEKVMRHIPIIGLLFGASWYIYGVLASHRGRSHHIIWGTLSRVLWSLALVVFWSLFASGLAAWLSGQWQPWPTMVLLWLAAWFNPWILAGWWLQDIIHIALDWAW